jgi:hypothetical protein
MPVLPVGGDGYDRQNPGRRELLAVHGVWASVERVAVVGRPVSKTLPGVTPRRRCSHALMALAPARVLRGALFFGAQPLVMSGAEANHGRIYVRSLTGVGCGACSRLTSDVCSSLPSRPAHLWSIGPRDDRRQPEDSRRALPWLARHRGTSGTRPLRPGSLRSTDEPDDSGQPPTPIRPQGASTDQFRRPTLSCGQP